MVAGSHDSWRLAEQVRRGHTYGVVVSGLDRERSIWVGGEGRKEADSTGKTLSGLSIGRKPSPALGGGHGAGFSPVSAAGFGQGTFAHRSRSRLDDLSDKRLAPSTPDYVMVDDPADCLRSSYRATAGAHSDRTAHVLRNTSCGKSSVASTGCRP